MQPDNSKHIDGDGENCPFFHGRNATKNIDWNDVACNFKERRFICSKPICSSGKACFTFKLCLHELPPEIQQIKSVSEAGNPLTAIIASISSVVLLLSIASTVFLLHRRKKNVKEEVVAQGDENPVYGMYYFANGEHIDYGSAEVQDNNEYYGT